MKRNLLRCLTLGGALLLSLACNNARAGYVLEVQSTYNSDKNEWSFADGYWTDSWKNSSGERAKQVAVSNGVVYGAIPGTRVLNYWNPSTKSLGKTSQAGTEVGNNIATDDAGNLIYSAMPGGEKVYCIYIVSKSSASGAVVDISKRKYMDLKGFDTWFKSANSATEYFHASGDLYNGNGALWFTDGFTVVKVPIENGESVDGSEVVYDIPDNASHTDSDPTSWWAQSRFRPYAEGKYLLQNYKGLFDCTISSGGEMTCTQIGTNAMAANIGYLKDHEILVYSKCNRSNGAGDGAITVYDRTTGIEMLTFYARGNYEAPSYANINAWCEFEKIDENTLALYTFIPHAGFAKFLIKATADGTPLTATIAKRSDSNYQDVSLSWGEPYLASSVTLQYRKKYVKDGATCYTSWSSLVEKTTERAYTHSNVYWYNDADGFYKTTVEYRLIYHYDTMDSKTRLLTLTAEVEPELLPMTIDWDVNRIQNYPGYQKVQLFWKTTGTGSKPKYYNIYRDGEKINSRPVQVYNYIDEKIPVGDHTYYVEAFLSDDIEAPMTTSEEAVTIIERDPMKTTYSIEVIYNYPIGSGANMVKPQGNYANLLSINGIWYKQAKYYRGYWYLNQCRDANTDTDAGVIKLTADNKRILTETATRVVSHTRNRSLGVTMDDGGNIFLRKQGTSASRASYSYELGYGTVYLKDASTSTGYRTTGIDVDLTGCQINDGNGYEGDYLYIGRVDYFEMEGDLSQINSGNAGDTNGIAYLYVSGHRTKRSNKIMLKRTGENTIVASLVNKTDISILSNQGTEFDKGDENYVFPIQYLTSTTNQSTGVVSYTMKSRPDYIHNLRSRGYFDITPGATPASAEQRAIYETRSRVNNAGGCTIGFNNELFMITPQSVYSKNTGNFIVVMGNRFTTDANGDDIDNGVANADLVNNIPVAQYTQAAIDDGKYTDANCIWLYAVHGTIAGEKEVYENITSQNHDCVYIYQYVPGIRFAKYRLVPNNYFPATPVTFEIETAYKQDGTDNVDILGFDGVVKWQKPDYAEAGGGNINYERYSYTLVIKNAVGDTLDLREIPVDAAIEDVNGYYMVEYPFNGNGVQSYNGNEVLLRPNENGSARPYYAYVTVNYRNKDTETYPNDKHKSEQTVDEDRAGYEGVGATGTVTVVPSAPINAGKDGSGNQYLQELDRVDINIDAPDFNEAGKEEEPVSHYEIWVDKDGDGVYEYQLPGFNLMNGGEGQYIEVNDGKIPGDYDFSNEDYAIAGGKDEATNQATNGATVVASPTTLFFNVTGEPYIKGTTPPEKGENEDPAKWKYQVVTVYASTTQGDTNRDISQTYSNGMSTSKTDVMTDIDGVMAGGELKVYPVPVKSQLTIESPESLETVKIYSISGVMVQSFVFNGEEIATIDVDSLAPGYYFVIVNNLTPVKIIKQ